jgi:hypothetical protein
MGLVARHLLDVTKPQKVPLERAPASSSFADTIQFPKRILYPSNFLPVANSEQQTIIDAFTTVLEDYLAVQSEKIDIKELWKANTPEAAGGKSLEEFLSKVSTALQHTFFIADNPLECILANVLRSVQ